MGAQVDPNLASLLRESAADERLIDAVLTLDLESLRRCGTDPSDAAAVLRCVAERSGAATARARFFPRLGVLRLSARAGELSKLLRVAFVRTAAAAEGFSISAAQDVAPPPTPSKSKNTNALSRRKRA